jgi:peptidoglycan/LPS O-acetylase OafA/YrhL
MQNNHERVYGLDIFRAIAIMVVVLSHGSLYLNETPFSDFPYIKMIDGVDLFFVLSGFLIGNILLKEINKPQGFGLKSMALFWKRRWFRTLPLYYLILLLNYIVVKQGIILGDIKEFNINFIFFTQNFATPFYNFFWESWSLCVEEWFYIFTPLLLLLLLQFTSPKRAFLFVVLIMLIVPVIYRAIIYDAGMDKFWFDVTFRKVVLTRLDAIAYGLLAAWAFTYYTSYWNRFKYHALAFGVGSIFFILNFNSENAFYKQLILLSITPLAAMFLLPFAESIKTGRGVVAKAVTHISKISYAMYLINLALVAEIINLHFFPQGTTERILTYLAFWFIVIVASTILYRFYEKPIMNLGRKN